MEWSNFVVIIHLLLVIMMATSIITNVHRVMFENAYKLPQHLPHVPQVHSGREDRMVEVEVVHVVAVDVAAGVHTIDEHFPLMISKIQANFILLNNVLIFKLLIHH